MAVYKYHWVRLILTFCDVHFDSWPHISGIKLFTNDTHNVPFHEVGYCNDLWHLFKLWKLVECYFLMEDNQDQFLSIYLCVIIKTPLKVVIFKYIRIGNKILSIFNLALIPTLTFRAFLVSALILGNKLMVGNLIHYRWQCYLGLGGQGLIWGNWAFPIPKSVKEADQVVI